MTITESKLPGIASIACGLALLTVLLYEPANIMNALGLQNVVSEGTVALGALTAVAALGATGIASLRAAR